MMICCRNPAETAEAEAADFTGGGYEIPIRRI
jgi:hypothetical protein